MLVLPTSSSGATGPAAIRVQSAALSAPQTLMMSSHPRISVEAGSTGCAGRSSAFEMPSNSGKPARTAMHRYPSFCIVANSAVDDRYTYNQELSMPSSTEGDQRTFMQLAPPPGSFLHSSLCDTHISTIYCIAYKLLTSFESLLLSKVTLLSTVVEFGGIAAKKSRTFLSSCCAGCVEDDMTLLQLDQRSVRTEKSLMLLAC